MSKTYRREEKTRVTDKPIKRREHKRERLQGKKEARTNA